ncbi:MAG: TonB-dependent receptor [Bacteroidota bacterium]
MLSILRPFAILTLVVLLATNVLAVGSTGKIRGKVTDKQTGEALIGSSVIIEGTSLGASTDINGEYIILNVQPGKYELRTSYLGYQKVNISNVQVNIDLTTEINFQLSSEAVSLQAVQIVAEAPLVTKSATNTIVQIRSDEIQNIPVRGVQNLVALSGGIVSQGGNLYVRGGRAGEVAYYVDGVLVNNPMNRTSSLTVNNNAVEEISTQIGGMTAEYGNALSGVVNTSTKIGSQKYTISAEAMTDGFLSGEQKYLNTYSYGLNEYVLTIGGPLIPNNQRIRFFLAGSRIFNRSDASFLSDVNFPNTFDTTDIGSADFIVNYMDTDSGSTTGLGNGQTGRRTTLANMLNSVDLKGGRNFGGLSNDAWSLLGNIFIDFSSFNVKVGGSYNFSTNIGSVGKGFNVLRIVDKSYRPGKTETTDGSAYVKFTHIIDQSTYYTVNGSYFTYLQEVGDNILFRDYEEYGNYKNPANASLIGPSRELPLFQVYGFNVNSPGFMSQKTYNKVTRNSVAGRFDFVRQISKAWEFKVGAEAQRYTLRTYSIPGFNLALSRVQNPTASDWKLYNSVNVNFYGYDIYGNEFDGGTFTDKTGFKVNLPKEGPRHPIIAGSYIQNKIELPDLIINAGVRFDYIDPGTEKYKNAGLIGISAIDGVNIVSDSSMTAQDVTMQISPRIGFSFPVTDQTVFHAEYGKFIAQGALNDLYDSRTSAGRFLIGGLARQFPNPNLKPERTTDYQIGFKQQIGDVSAFDLSFFYKDTKDLIVIRQFLGAPGAEYGAYISNANGDFGTVRGFTLRFDVRRTNRISMNANYTLQSAQSTGSTSASHFDIAWQDVSGPGGVPYFPVIASPTDFDRAHFGNVSLDYRFAENDGPTWFGTKALERVGANFLFTFSSGRRYTVQQVSSAFGEFNINAPVPFENLNASTAPWNYQLDLRLNKEFNLVQGVDADVYLWVVNVLNTKNIVNIYQATGLPDNDGFFSTGSGETFVNTKGEEGKTLYNYLVDNPANYGTPRIMRLGVRLTF